MVYDVIVVGGGHAGIEAASAAARLKQKTALITLHKNTIGLMSCNPAIGGLAKGHLVREIDALGGLMAKIIDHTGIHFKMLNKSKGPAVWSPRAQADKAWYASYARELLEQTPNLTIIEDSGIGITEKNGKISGVKTERHGDIKTRSVILTAGTFLNGVIYIGLKKMKSGRAGEEAAYGITEDLQKYGLLSGRLKTGTPPRISFDSINFDKMERQDPDSPPEPFSFSTNEIENRQIPMYITYTNRKTHDFLRTGFDRSPLFTGRISGAGPRYCPSIEDKINRFAGRERHQLFIEPEGYNTKEVYLNGFSTSLPAETQEKALKTIPGLENAQILRLGYAVEYDFFMPHQIKRSMESKIIENLFLAGQINGTSGYEEAAAQGFIAGVNAAHKLRGDHPLQLSRSEAYIGVMIDDLITKSTDEPYRMFTSSAEFRLLLRHDNADLRLIEKGHQLGLVDDRTYAKSEKKKEATGELNRSIEALRVSRENFSGIAEKRKTSPISQTTPAKKLLKRPEVKLKDLLPFLAIDMATLDPDVLSGVEFEIKYDGYIKRMLDDIQRYKKQEKRRIPADFDYQGVKSLSNEAKEKLSQIRPENLGQAGNISGVKPGDITSLMISLEKKRRSTLSDKK